MISCPKILSIINIARHPKNGVNKHKYIAPIDNNIKLIIIYPCIPCDIFYYKSKQSAFHYF